MLTKTLEITQNKWIKLCEGLAESQRGRFRTDTVGESYWRQFMASDPVASFVLDRTSNLNQLQTFLQENSDKLCGGYFSYDLGRSLHDVPSRHDRQQPLAIFHAYDQWLEYSGTKLLLNVHDEQYLSFIHDQLNTEQATRPRQAHLNFDTSVSAPDYKQTIEKIHDYIRAGDFYQLNFTQALESHTTETPDSLYSQLIKRHPAAYGCYFEHDELAIHSLSPELFLHHSDGVLTTEPIKGTRPRGSTLVEDKQFSRDLLESEKEQAELFMITDLLRNDLGAVCSIGSVRLEAVRELRKLPKVWHTYSKIKGELSGDLQPLDALLSMLPGGSITGCPKKRAMEVIDEIEIASRGIYTGTLGYFHPDGDFCFNIAIRTLVQQAQTLTLGSGGGITIDSNWQDEWDELLVKASTFA